MRSAFAVLFFSLALAATACGPKPLPKGPPPEYEDPPPPSWLVDAGAPVATPPTAPTAPTAPIVTPPEPGT